MNNTYLNPYNSQIKEMVIHEISNGNIPIDTYMRELVDEINRIKFLCTTNCCQGALIKASEDEHAPRTYVEFAALYHKYNIAHEYLSYLTHKLGDLILCTAKYYADYDYFDDDYVDENGQIDLLFDIEILNTYSQLEEDNISVYNELVAATKEFKLYINQKYSLYSDL